MDKCVFVCREREREREREESLNIISTFISYL